MTAQALAVKQEGIFPQNTTVSEMTSIFDYVTSRITHIKLRDRK